MLFRFGNFQINTENSTISRGGKPIPLTPKAYSVLLALIESRGDVVTKSELLEIAWSGLVVTDSAIKVCINEIRKALEDNPKSPTFIQTVHKRGYRFINPFQQESPGIEDKADNRFLPSVDSTLDGRASVVNQLDSVFAETLQGQARLVLISGEPGIGKTTVVNYFCDTLISENAASICRGLCVNHDGGTEAYLPILDAIGDLCRQKKNENIVEILQQHAPSWLLQLPALLDADQREQLTKQSAGISGEQMLREMTNVLQVLSQNSPLVIFLEDLHWSDSATIDLLGHIAHRQQSSQLMIIGTVRPVEIILNRHPLKKLKQSLLAHNLCIEIALELLQVADVSNYLQARFGKCECLPVLAQTVHNQTEGNPLFMVNLTKYLVDQHFVVETDGRWRPEKDLESVNVPNNLRDVIIHQVTCLNENDQDLLKIMSVVGMRSSVLELQAASSLSIEDIETTCERLMETSIFISFEDFEQFPDGATSARFVFNHSIYEKVLYQEISPLRRLRLHHAIGIGLERIYQGQADTHASEMAHHFIHAKDFIRAIDYLRISADTAVQRHAYQQAKTIISDGIGFLPQVRNETVRMKLELDLHIILGPVLIALEGNASEAVESCYLRAQQLAELIQDPAKLFPVLFGLRGYYQFSGQLEKAHEYSIQLLKLADQSGDDNYQLEACVAMASTHYFLGNLKDSRDYAMEGVRLYNPNRHRNHLMHYGSDPGVFCLSRFAQVSWMLGFPTRALKEIEKALVLGKSLVHPYSLVFAIHNATQIHLYRLDADAALKSAMQGKQLVQQHEFSFISCWGSYLLAWAQALSNNHTAALAELDRAMSAPIPKSRTTRDYLQIYLAEIYFHLQMPKPGLIALNDILSNGHEFTYIGENFRLQGDFLLMQCKPKEAEIKLLKAVERNRETGAASYQLRAALSLAKLWIEDGKPKQARTLLEESLQLFDKEENSLEIELAMKLLRNEK